MDTQKLTEKELEDYNQAMQNISKKRDECIHNLHFTVNEFLNTDGSFVIRFEECIKEILLLSWLKCAPETFLTCFAVNEDFRKRLEFVFTQNQYYTWVRLSQGKLNAVIDAMKLSDYDRIGVENNEKFEGNVCSRRLKMVHDFWIYAFEDITVAKQEGISEEDYCRNHALFTEPEKLISLCTQFIR